MRIATLDGFEFLGFNGFVTAPVTATLEIFGDTQPPASAIILARATATST